MRMEARSGLHLDPRTARVPPKPCAPSLGSRGLQPLRTPRPGVTPRPSLDWVLGIQLGSPPVPAAAGVQARSYRDIRLIEGARSP